DCWFIHTKFISFNQIGFGLIVNFLYNKLLSSMTSFWCFVTGGNNDQTYNNLICSSVCQLLSLPIMTTLIKISIQGYSLVVDVLTSNFPNSALTTALINPTFHKGFSDCFLSIYQDCGFSGYFHGIIPIIASFIAKFLVIYINNRLLDRYFRYSRNC
ncbi:hypothetical protein MXB_5149, partial [Myxobolus squamalis]